MMLNFAEQTGSGAVIMVWSFLIINELLKYRYSANIYWSTHWKTELHVTERRNARDLMHLGPFDSSSTTCSLLQFESRKTDKHLSREPTRLRSQHNARLIFKGVSWRNFWACFCNNWTYIDEVLAFCGWLLFVVGGRKSHKHLSQEPTRLRSQNNASPIFQGVSWRNFWARLCNNWIYIGEVLDSAIEAYAYTLSYWRNCVRRTNTPLVLSLKGCYDPYALKFNWSCIVCAAICFLKTSTYLCHVPQPETLT